jgi:hypothetical protein
MGLVQGISGAYRVNMAGLQALLELLGAEQIK